MRLFVLEVDGAGDGLVAAFDRRHALANRDALHPLARHIAEAEGRRKPFQEGDVFEQHLRIDARKSKQLNLFAARHGIAVADVDRGRILETLAQVATGQTAQAFGSDYFGLLDGCHFAERRTPATADPDLLEDLSVAAQAYFHHSVGSGMDNQAVGGIPHIAGKKQMRLGMLLDNEMPAGVGQHPRRGAIPGYGNHIHRLTAACIHYPATDLLPGGNKDGKGEKSKQ